jgi:group I intron endonuclease
MAAGIYALRNRITGRVYVGRATSLEDRRVAHLTELRGGYHANRHLTRDWAAHGADAFEWTILEYVTDPARLERVERRWIRRLLADGAAVLYNATSVPKISRAERCSRRTHYLNTPCSRVCVEVSDPDKVAYYQKWSERSRAVAERYVEQRKRRRRAGAGETGGSDG